MNYAALQYAIINGFNVDHCSRSSNANMQKHHDNIKCYRSFNLTIPYANAECFQRNVFQIIKLYLVKDQRSDSSSELIRHDSLTRQLRWNSD